MGRVSGWSLLVVAGLVCTGSSGCLSEPEQELPPADLEGRTHRLNLVREELEVLKGAGFQAAAERLGHADHRVRRAAAQRLAELGPDAGEAVDELVARLEDEQPRVQTAAAIALGRIGDMRALDPLVAALVDEDRHVRLWAWKGIRGLGDEAVPLLVAHMGKKSPLRSMQYMDEAGNRRSIRMELRDRLSALGPGVIPQMMEAARSDDEWIQVNAIRILGANGEEAEEALPLLVETLEDGKVYARRVAAQALGLIGDLDPSVMPALQRANKDKDAGVVREARAAIKAIERAAKDKKSKQKKAEKRREEAAKRAKAKKVKGKGVPLPEPQSGIPGAPIPGAAPAADKPPVPD